DPSSLNEGTSSSSTWSDLPPPSQSLNTKSNLAQISGASALASKVVFVVHFVLLGCFLWGYWRKSKNLDRAQYLKKYPWIDLEEAFQANQKFPLNKVAEKLDLWTRLRIIGYLDSLGSVHELHSESARSAFVELLKQGLAPDYYTHVDALR